MTVGEARIIIHFFKLGHSVESIQYMTGKPIETIKEIVKGAK